jgi:hypothetical protein
VTWPTDTIISDGHSFADKDARRSVPGVRLLLTVGSGLASANGVPAIRVPNIRKFQTGFAIPASVTRNYFGYIIL